MSNYTPVIVYGHLTNYNNLTKIKLFWLQIEKALKTGESQVKKKNVEKSELKELYKR